MSYPVVISFGDVFVEVASATLDSSGLVRGFNADGKIVVCVDPKTVGLVTVAPPKIDWRSIFIAALNVLGCRLAPDASHRTIKNAVARIRRAHPITPSQSRAQLERRLIDLECRSGL